MKKAFACALLLTALTACQSNSPGDRALVGGALGAGTGALIGGAATGRGSGALAGAAIGGVGGAVIGAATTPEPVYGEPRYRQPAYRGGWCNGYDEYGNPIQVRC